ncbi:MAG: sporulation protein YqfD [Lachnospiraceae bacterium]|nr:sporulation protein YqfD [Lachnospiraceae bacterium]
MIPFFNYIKGYVRIRLKGGSPERFLNLCSNNNILIWQVVRIEDEYEMYLSLQAFRELKSIIRKTNVRIKVVERKGLPFFLYRYRKRKMFFAGIVICAVFVYILSLFVWQIEINGNYARTTDVLLRFLEANNVSHGMRKSEVNCEEIETMLRAEYNDIIWTSVKLKGTRLIIDVQENTDTSIENISAEEASDLYAQKEAIITEIVTRNGSPYVAKGDVVKAGDLLVGGALPITNDSDEIINYQYVAADADIYGKTIYEYEDSFDLKYKKHEDTGNVQKGLYLKIHEKSIFLGKKKIKFEHYHTLSDIRQLKFGENFYLPFSIGTVKVFEEKVQNSKYTKKEAELLAKKRLLKFLETLKEKGVQIQENNVTIDVDQNQCKVSGTITVIEKLGIRKKASIIQLDVDGKENEIDGETGDNY